MKIYFLLFIFSLLITGCVNGEKSVYKKPGDWNYSDLRALDPAEAGEPNGDIVATYSRFEENDLLIRVDFLDLVSNQQPFSLAIAFDNGLINNPSRSSFRDLDISWNYLLIIGREGTVTFLDNDSNNVNASKIRIIRDPNLSAYLIFIKKNAIKGISIKTKLSVITFGIDNSIIDTVPPFSITAHPPPPGKITIAFTNAIRTDTPAQVLRSWDGAHTGSYSSRNGLRFIVEAIEETGIPVVFFDLAQPKVQSALDYIGVAERIQKLINQQKIILPDHDILFPFDRLESAEIFDLSGNIPSISLRRKLINAAYMNKPLLLGGSLPDSSWGNYDIANRIFSYIKAHPWLRPVPGEDYFHLRNVPDYYIPDPSFREITYLISKAPDNKIKNIAENLLISLSTPGTQRENLLKENYRGQIGHLISIANWSEHRQPISNCSQDLDWDGESECLIASNTIAAVIDLQGGFIPYAFVFSDGDFHQVIGPSYQLVASLSDQMAWDLNLGFFADPSLIPGAFMSINDKESKYIVTKSKPGELSIRKQDSKDVKIFQLTREKITFLYNGFVNERFTLPLVLDPWMMKSENWAESYSSNISAYHFSWSLSDHLLIDINSTDPLEVSTFKDSYHLIKEPENPNFEYPAGHYLPFPLVKAEFISSGAGSIQITISP